jgi:hypothetical protein
VSRVALTFDVWATHQVRKRYNTVNDLAPADIHR